MVAAVGRNVVLWSTTRSTRLGSVHPFSHPSGVCGSGDGAQLAVMSTAGDGVVLDGETLGLQSSMPALAGEDSCGPLMSRDRSIVLQAGQLAFAVVAVIWAITRF